MSKTIAICMNLPACQEDFRDPMIGKRYPGAGFLPHLAKLADANGISIQGGKFISKIDSDVLVLQEELNTEGLSLIEKGARPKVFFCMESPLYAPHVYDMLDGIKKVFPAQILFGGLGTHRLYFPSFDLAEFDVFWPLSKDRKELCMISSNKQWWSMRRYPHSPAWLAAISSELHTARLQAIADHPEMDLYGPGWGNLSNLPPDFEYLKPQIAKMWKGTIEDKLETLSQYKASYCYENVNLPGYKTEKAPHCIVVGTTPLGNQLEMDIENHSNEHFAKQVMELLIA